MKTSKWISTKFPGVRYRKHPTKKHGIKFDRYFTIRYQLAGKRREEGLGWTSQGWTAEKAALTLAELKNAAKTGTGEATRLSEKRAIVRKRNLKKKREKITFKHVFKNNYYPQAKADKEPETVSREESLFRLWISPVVGTLPFKDIAPIHIEKIKQNMLKAKRSPRTVNYMLAVIRQVFNFATRDNFYQGDNPVNQVKKPKIDNKRLRFLTRDEADTLLQKLKTEDPEMWEIALLSLHCGLRASEIFRLTRIDLNLEEGLIAIKNAKGSKTRYAYMTKYIKEMFSSKKMTKPKGLLYPAPGGSSRREIPRSFERVVKLIGLNTGIEGRRDKFVYHSLRHTYASWLVQQGVDIYLVKERLGHSTLAMTERYAHLAPENSQKTIAAIENFAKSKDDNNVINIEDKV
jgi:integrase